MTGAMARDALRALLLDDADAARRLASADVALLASNVVLVRVAAALARLHVEPARPLAEAAAGERARIARVVALLPRLQQACAELRVQAAFPKALQHDADMGHDVDLLVLDRSRRIDAWIADELQGAAGASSFSNRVAGKTAFELPDGTAIEVHHARLGQMGEHASLAAGLVARALPHPLEGGAIRVPTPEDALLVQASQRVYAHRSMRIADVVAGARLAASKLDVERLREGARASGIVHGLRRYVGALDAVLRDATGRGLEAPPVEPIPTPCAFERGVYRFSASRVAAPAYARKLGHDAASLRWASAARIALLPIVAFAASRRREER